MYDDFSSLRELYPGKFVEVGYHGNMYQVILNSVTIMNEIYSHTIFDATRYHLVLQELRDEGYVMIGEATFNYSTYSYSNSLELKDQIRSAIIQLNIKPTDYYK
jgi:hypothetical protein